MTAVARNLRTQLMDRWHAPSGYREVLALAGPLVLSTGTATLQQFINRVFLSWYSTDALAASMPAGVLSFTVLCFFIGTASYANTFVAQYHGARRPDRIASAVWQAVYLSAIATVLIAPIALLAGPVFELAGHAPALRKLEAPYFAILTAGGGFGVMSSALSAFFTGRGRTRTVMWVNLATTAINCGLDYVLIFGRFGLPQMGIAGAAWATVISSAIGAAVFMALFVLSAESRRHHVWQMRAFDRDLFGRLLRFGAPSGLHFMLDLLAWSFFILLVGRLGVVELGATNLAFQVNNLIFMPMIGFAIATSTLVGQRLGEGRPDLAARATWSAFHLTFSYMTGLAVLYVLMPLWFLAPFGARANPEEFAPLRDMAAIMLRFVALYSIFDAINLVFSAALKGAGDTVVVMVVSCALSVSVMVLPTYLICRDGQGSVWAVWSFLTLFIILLAGVFMVRFLGDKWKTMRVTETTHAPLNPTYPGPDAPITDFESS